MKLKNANYQGHWSILAFCDQWKMMSELNMSHGKMSNFVSLPLFGFTLVTKIRNLDFESLWNTLSFDKKNMRTDLNMSHGKMSDFVSLPLFGFTLVIKLRNFHFKGY